MTFSVVPRRIALPNPLQLLPFLLLFLLTRRSLLLPQAPRFSATDEEVLRNASIQLATGRDHGFSSRTVFLAPITHHLLPLYLNQRCHFRRVMPDIPVVLVALDRQVAATASALSMPHVRLLAAGHFSGSNMAIFNSHSFHRVSKLKLLAVRNVLALGLDAVLMDADLVFCRDVRPLLRREVMLREMKGQRPHVLIQNNLPTENEKRCGLNTGFYYARASQSTVDLFERLVAESDSKLGRSLDDQDLLHRIMCDEHKNGIREGKCMARGSGKSVRTRCVWKKNGVVAQALPITDFPNGRKDVWRMGAKSTMKEACIRGRFAMLHVNYRYGPTKQPYLQKNGLWLLKNKSSFLGRCLRFSPRLQ